MTEFTNQRIVPSRGETLKFQGREIAFVTDHKPGREKWLEMVLWETPAGNWVGEFRGCVEDREKDFVKVATFGPTLEFRERELAVMDFFEWSILARSLGKKMGWKFVREVP